MPCIQELIQSIRSPSPRLAPQCEARNACRAIIPGCSTCSESDPAVCTGCKKANFVVDATTGLVRMLHAWDSRQRFLDVRMGGKQPEGAGAQLFSFFSLQSSAAILLPCAVPSNDVSGAGQPMHGLHKGEQVQGVC